MQACIGSHRLQIMRPDYPVSHSVVQYAYFYLRYHCNQAPATREHFPVYKLLLAALLPFATACQMG